MEGLSLVVPALFTLSFLRVIFIKDGQVFASTLRSVQIFGRNITQHHPGQNVQERFKIVY